MLKRPSLVKAIPPGTAKEALRFLLSFKKLATILNPPKLDWKFKDRGDHFLLDAVAHVDADFLVMECAPSIGGFSRQVEHRLNAVFL